MNLVMDSDSAGTFGLVLVEGKLMFYPDVDPNHQRTFDFYHMFINNGGLLQIGTEDEPYTSKITFTFHGDRSTPKIPTYGNKVIV